jgi:hypothetical protein
MMTKTHLRNNFDINFRGRMRVGMARVMVMMVAHSHSHSVMVLVKTAVVKSTARRPVMRRMVVSMMREAHFQVDCDFNFRRRRMVMMTVMRPVRPVVSTIWIMRPRMSAVGPVVGTILLSKINTLNEILRPSSGDQSNGKRKQSHHGR